MTFFDVVNPMLAALPDIVYRVSILGSYRMDPRLLLAGMTVGVLMPPIMQREFFLLGVMPDIFKRASILGSYRMDTHLKPRVMT